ncbi:hypothetical protein Y900_008985 [Mycolicibacterium aromaticivorans JS19b1 = JCM 16368]|uniref:DUF2771 domain-containing protein n=1 Tax=Mycolicibacterium aromaticivorans JS19b1 = JCM 16368 TaxID=1440774 RepID=A0A064CEM4_9MYCO|nr:DUF2771 domain-containing protein [Mycolicibacterium aromaticivorans]KDE99079.1 hypothetical protein Y900_008985 [Mycolicibacterium aromaticivorans JS19b1 = JCM 16368]
MNRLTRWLLVIVVVLASAGAGVAAWALTRGTESTFPEISAYSHGKAVRIGPYVYCNVVNLNDCQNPQTQGQLSVTERYPVQLSVPTAIGRAPWQLLRVYEDERNSTTTMYRPNTELAVTIPTVDPQRGRLTGVVVQLVTLVQDQNGELRDAPHAEWSVRLAWP